MCLGAIFTCWSFVVLCYLVFLTFLRCVNVQRKCMSLPTPPSSSPQSQLMQWCANSRRPLLLKFVCMHAVSLRPLTSRLFLLYDLQSFLFCWSSCSDHCMDKSSISFSIHLKQMAWSDLFQWKYYYIIFACAALANTLFLFWIYDIVVNLTPVHASPFRNMFDDITVAAVHSCTSDCANFLVRLQANKW